ncbi:hypothetical protein SK128_010012 [Halocaridina rubra]|uniref:Uncharacterized protein n=1 Tax=Halocaridina rubra TaxID=373956 RepID=A0AAN9A762_HALRR
MARAQVNSYGRQVLNKLSLIYFQFLSKRSVASKEERITYVVLQMHPINQDALISTYVGSDSACSEIRNVRRRPWKSCPPGLMQQLHSRSCLKIPLSFLHSTPPVAVTLLFKLQHSLLLLPLLILPKHALHLSLHQLLPSMSLGYPLALAAASPSYEPPTTYLTLQPTEIGCKQTWSWEHVVEELSTADSAGGRNGAEGGS